MRLINFFRKLKQKFNNYNPIVEVLIFKDNLLFNLKTYKEKYPKLLFAPVLKSNAYGHGIFEIAKILDNEKVPFFVLDSLYEASLLRNKGIKSKLLVMGFTTPENIKNCRLKNLAFTITSIDQLKGVVDIINSPITIHLKIDTGMHRQGILENQIDEAIKIIKSNKYLSLEGICSHFADADGEDETFTKDQIKQWNNIVSIFKKTFDNIKFFHISNTSGTFFEKLFEANVVRLGLGLYGINSSPKDAINLKPVLQMRSILAVNKFIDADEYVGYNNKYQVKKGTKISTVPVGYFEGVDRRLSNTGVFKIGDKFCPIIGMVSMNITSIDITSVPDSLLQDKVIIISNNKLDKNSVENIAKICQTIPWEILVHIPAHLRRIVV